LAEPLVSIQFDEASEDGTPLWGIDEATLRQIAALTLARAGVTQAVELSIVITSDDALRALNRDYRGRDEVTDVLSFPLLDAPLADAPAEELWASDDGEEAVHGGFQRDRAADTVVESIGEHSDQQQTEAVDATDDEAAFTFVTPPELPLQLGDIVIARDMTERQARQAGHSAAWELAYLVAHGVLHLVGYDDHTDAGYEAMVGHQRAVLQLAGITP
jgi:probable rRNA maturation factor